MDSPSDQHAAPQALHVGMEAHRAAWGEESGRDGDGNRVVMLVMAISIAIRARDVIPSCF